MGASR
ncbi:Pyoverdine side chain non-ribosomal peptide synthetase, partial [Pseudomonas syringae pv. aptata]